MAKASNLSGEERLALVLESLRNEQSTADLCRQHGISQTTFYKWRDKFLEGGRNALLRNGSSSTPSETAQGRIQELERVIGRQTVEIQILKKNLHLR